MSFAARKAQRWAAWMAGLWALGSALVGCNGHPLEPLDQVVVAARQQTQRLPPKAKMDFLFVVDSSSSMCQEQDNLSRNFSAFAELFETLGAAADFRIAVTSMDMRNPDQPGRFLASPALAVPAQNCNQRVPNTADCPADLPAILRSGPDGNLSDAADLELKFRCLATLGTGGDGIEMGLESMRRALSCSGPNAASFGPCCRLDGTYDPACAPGPDEAPDFLRPDAILAVVFISDEDDCSDPAANPGASTRVICKYGAGDSDGDGMPDGFRDPDLCPEGAPACFARECGDLDAETCRAERCAIDKTANHHCAWQRDRLTPVTDYRRFLTGLKARPRESILVASIVGERAYTHDGGNLVHFEAGTYADARCDPADEAFEVQMHRTEACCPSGVCPSTPEPSCDSGDGQAYAGQRYLQLAEQFGDNGVGCPRGSEGIDGACNSICTDNLSAPLRAISDLTQTLLRTYCLDAPAACRVMDVDGPRACQGVDERAEASHYQIRVRTRCARAVEQGGDCESVEDRIWGPDTFELRFDEPTCAGGMLVRLKSSVPPGSALSIDYRVEFAR